MKALRMVHCKDDQNGEEFSSELKNQPPLMFRHDFPPFSSKRGAICLKILYLKELNKFVTLGKVN